MNGSGSYQIENEDIDEVMMRLIQFKETAKIDGVCLYCNSAVDDATDDLICLAMTCLTEFIRRTPKKAAFLVPTIIQQFSSYALVGSVEMSHVSRQVKKILNKKF